MRGEAKRPQLRLAATAAVVLANEEAAKQQASASAAASRRAKPFCGLPWEVCLVKDAAVQLFALDKPQRKKARQTH